jgi:hypothetical protein
MTLALRAWNYIGTGVPGSQHITHYQPKYLNNPSRLKRELGLTKIIFKLLRYFF